MSALADDDAVMVACDSQRERLEAALVDAVDGADETARVAVASALERAGWRQPGWTPAAVAEALLAGYPLVGRARAAISGRPGTAAAWWQPADEGEDVVTVAEAAWLPSCALALNEVVACDPRDVGRWWRLSGGQWALGERHLQAALEDGSRACLVRRPLAWARAGGAAADLACVLDWTVAPAIDLLLADIELIACDPGEDGASALEARVAHGEALARRVQAARPRGARIAVLDDEPAEAEAA